MASNRIGIVGTFDVANFGDLLFPLLAEHELSRRLGEVELVRYSYRELGEDAWPYAVRPVENLAEDVGGLDLLIVGGGDLIRVDTYVAPGYLPTTPTVHHPTGYWLMPTLVARSAGVPVVWNAVGIVGPLADWGRELVGLGADAATIVTVRDEASLEELVAIGGSVRPRVVPDTCFGIQSLLRHDGGARLLLEELGVDERYVVVQPSPGLAASKAELARALDELSARGVHAVELPISPILGDSRDLLRLGDQVARPERWPHPLLLAEIISGAQGVIAQSLHLSIVALTAGVPVFRRPAPARSKYEALHRFERVHTWSTLEDLLELVEERLGRRPDADPVVLEQVAQLSPHWDAVAALVSAEQPIDTAFTGRLSGLVAKSVSERAASDRAAAALVGERDTVAGERDTVAGERDTVAGERDTVAAQLATAQTELAAQRDRSAEADRQLEALRRRLDAAEWSGAQTQAHLDALVATKSWRLLAPLRALRTFGRGGAAVSRRHRGGRCDDA